ALHHARTKIGDQHVGRTEQPSHRLLPSGRCQVEGERSLAPIQSHEIGAHAAAEDIIEVTGAVASIGVLDLDYVGAEISQKTRGPRPGDKMREIDNSNPRKRRYHTATSDDLRR